MPRKKVARSEDDYRYLRVGYISREETTDKLVAQVIAKIPGDGVLPLHWKWFNLESFLERYSNLGTVLWSKTSSYHMMVLSGFRICRIWTNARHYCVIDVMPAVASVCASRGLKVTKIPDNTLLKTVPMQDRVEVHNEEDMNVFIDILVSVHGLQDWVKNA